MPGKVSVPKVTVVLPTDATGPAVHSSGAGRRALEAGGTQLHMDRPAVASGDVGGRQFDGSLVAPVRLADRHTGEITGVGLRLGGTEVTYRVRRQAAQMSPGHPADAAMMWRESPNHHFLLLFFVR
ncbi:hypothetical protein IPF89_05055 [Candidatus Saccharibacteria bacterium]|nr:MAG: hypothetical protein IPF89_05055 [Candidatus Saccharibacteria bacterium]